MMVLIGLSTNVKVNKQKYTTNQWYTQIWANQNLGTKVFILVVENTNLHDTDYAALDSRLWRIRKLQNGV